MLRYVQNFTNKENAMTDTPYKYLVAVVGAGPSGLFAARQLAAEGACVVLLNRDIKPGGLAEYGIYPTKLKMKEGLRHQFRQILDTPQIFYYGNMTVGNNGDISLEELCSLGFQSVLVTAGAQGTKWLGLPGEQLTGVYHAKDVVYHYNKLPPYSNEKFAIGKRVAVVGVGNVMLDISHWLIADQKVDEVIAVARRGPAEVKFDRKELEYVARNLDMAAVDAEIDRDAPIMRALGQDPEEPRALIHSSLAKALPTDSNTRFTLRFLTSPVRMIGDENGRMVGMEIEDNTLVLDKGETKARGTGVRQVLDVDSVIFAIGDRVDDQFGLPVAGTEYVKNPNPSYPVENASYEAFDPKTNQCLQGIFVAGWSRKASYGLVGYARKDGINGSLAVIQYLKSLPPTEGVDPSRWFEWVKQVKKPIVTQKELSKLFDAEQAEADRQCLGDFKYGTNDEMLSVMGLK
jgi:ferredoxin/flavodoxin---NADP+ reductase